jgi:hypothetical protein
VPIDGSADTLLLVVEGSLTVVWRDTTACRPSSAKVTPPRRIPRAVEVLLAGAEGATFFALVSRG